jgi:hypothetical protein
MLLAEMIRALICYAGSAPEASIGSKPIGTELGPDIGIIPQGSQDFFKTPSESSWRAFCGKGGQ